MNYKVGAKYGLIIALVAVVGVFFLINRLQKAEVRETASVPTENSH